MINLNAGDKLEAIVASDTNKIMFTVSGHDVGASPEIIGNQGYVETSNTEIYDAIGATRIYHFSAYNSHSSAITLTLNKDPGDAGTLWTFFKISLGIGYDLQYDGVNLTVRDASGRILKGYAAHAADHKDGGDDDLLGNAGVISCTTLAASDDLTLTNSTIIIASDGEGIDFSASEGGGADNSLLDDYEKGTWPPVLQGGSVAGTYELATAIGRYTKIGNMVTLWGRLVLAGSITGGGSGIMQIIGIPFAKGNNTLYCTGNISTHFVGLTAATVSLNIVFDALGASSVLVAFEVHDDATLTNIGIAGVSANDAIDITITYEV